MRAKMKAAVTVLVLLCMLIPLASCQVANTPTSGTTVPGITPGVTETDEIPTGPIPGSNGYVPEYVAYSVTVTKGDNGVYTKTMTELEGEPYDNAKAAAGELVRSAYFADIAADGTATVVGGTRAAAQYGAYEVLNAVAGGKTGVKLTGDYVKVAESLSANADNSNPAEGADLSKYSQYIDEGYACYYIDNKDFRGDVTAAPTGFNILTPGVWGKKNYSSLNLTGNNSAFAMTDDSPEKTAAMEREINRISEGKFTLEYQFMLVGQVNGFEVTLYSWEDGKEALSVYSKDGCWYASDGKVEEKITEAEADRVTEMTIKFDMDKNTYSVIIDGVASEELKMNDGYEYIDRVLFKTTEEAVMDVVHLNLILHTNYRVAERCIFQEWEVTGDNGWRDRTHNDGLGRPDDIYYLTLVGTDVTAVRSFEPINGPVKMQIKFSTPEYTKGVKISLNDGDSTVASLILDGAAMLTKGNTLVKEYYYSTVWQTLQFEIDTRTQSVMIRINYKDVIRVPFENLADSVDNIKIEIHSDNPLVLRLDDIQVWQNDLPEDYVPVPTVERTDDYMVGVTSFPMWREGRYTGWDCIADFPEKETVLGYYDGGSTEAMDWMIKYMIEYGFDFFIFNENGTSPASEMKNWSLHEEQYAFLDAEYSGLMKFAVGLTTPVRAGQLLTMADWKDYLVPYWVEYYFSDYRYATVDGKAIVSIYLHETADSLIEGGGETMWPKMIQHVEDTLLELGYEDMIMLKCAGDYERGAKDGFDYDYPYNGEVNTGREFEAEGVRVGQRPTYHYEEYIASYYESDRILPYMYIGFNGLGWSFQRNALMTKSEALVCMYHIRDVLHPTLPEDSARRRIITCGTLNEFGEGSAIFPNKAFGFDYFECIREVFGDGKKAGEFEECLPTEAQLERITKLFVQDRSHPVAQQKPDESDMITVAGWDFTNPEDFAKWTVSGEYESCRMTGDSVYFRNIKSDGLSFEITGLDIDAEDFTVMQLHAMYEYRNARVKIYFQLEGDEGFPEKHNYALILKYGLYHNNYIKAKNNEGLGKITGIKIEFSNCEGLNLELTNFHLWNANTEFAISVDGEKCEVDNEILYFAKEAGNTVYLPFIASQINAYYSYLPLEKLDLNYDYSAKAGTLTVFRDDTRLTFTVGSDKAILNGTETELPMAVYMVDGLPYVPADLLLDTFGIEYTYENGNLDITSVIDPGIEYAERRNKR